MLDFVGSTNKLLVFDIALFVVFKFNKKAYDKNSNTTNLPIFIKNEFKMGKKKTIIIIITLKPVIRDTLLTSSEKS